MILARHAGLNPAGTAEAKAWAIQSGISDGSTPGGNVSRQQMAAILYRYVQMMDYDISWTAALTSFPDMGGVSSYAQTPMAWSVANNIVGGTVQGDFESYRDCYPGAVCCYFNAVPKEFCKIISFDELRRGFLRSSFRRDLCQVIRQIEQLKSLKWTRDYFENIGNAINISRG